MKGLAAAIRTLTSIPVPGGEDEDLSRALIWFPAVGLVLGGILWLSGLLWLLLPFPQWNSCCALLLVILDVLLTRGLHLDGLADWADSMGSFDRDRRLAIMKDASMGAFGTIAIILCLMTKWIALERIIFSGTLFWIMPVMIISRAMMVELMTTMSYARSGEGMARPFMQNAGKGRRAVSLIIASALCLVSGPIGVGLFIIAWTIARIFRAYCLNRFGGITGDLLGASDEIIEVILLALCALAGEHISCCVSWGWQVWI
ncbi:MAG TPA: adenosylcobinamide-GDP ribazoletransferase [Desulfatiglandales bacterium]|nr:adenosylcobinamide-GDP ribazoletransferase [Desulfatiglandales bacterium]